MRARVIETGRSGVARTGRLAAVVAPSVRRGLDDPEIRAAAGRVVAHSRRVGRELGGEDLGSALRRVAADRRVQDEIGRSARALGDLTRRISRDAERRRRHLRLVGAVVVALAVIAGGGWAVLRSRRGREDRGMPAGRGAGAEVHPAGRPA
jgi:hypothetical protein